MRIDRFEDIEAWQLARELTRKINERKVTLNPASAGNPEPLSPYRCLKYISLCIAMGTTVLLLGSYFSDRAGAGQTLDNASYDEKGRSTALAFLGLLSKSPLEKIGSINVTYDLHLECEWMIDIKMSVTLNMKRVREGFVSTFRLTEPVGENLWGKFALFFFGRYTKAYKNLVKAIKSTAIETFHLRNGKFITDELIEILARKKIGKARKGFRIIFDYDQNMVKFWKDSSQKNPTASVKYENQVGPLTAYFNLFFFGQPENEICLINKQRRAKHVTTPGIGSFRKWNGDFRFASQVIRLQRNSTGKHMEYANVAYLGGDDFFDIVYGKYIYFNTVSMADSNVKAPHAGFLDGIIDKGKKRKKAKRLKKLKSRAKDRKSFEKELKAIEAMNILAAWNVKLHMTKADVAYE